MGTKSCFLNFNFSLVLPKFPFHVMLNVYCIGWLATLCRFSIGRIVQYWVLSCYGCVTSSTVQLVGLVFVSLTDIVVVF